MKNPPMSTMSSREFNQDVGRAKRDALDEPVVVTDRGRPTHVLMNFETFKRISGEAETIIDLLAMPGSVELDIDTVESGDGWDRREGLG